MKASLLKVIKSRWFIAAACLIIGAAVILGIRFFTYKPADIVHYHANFAVYVNGQREQFKSLKYYEETAASTCGVEQASEENNPMARVHMHGMVNDVVHVEDHLVTWGNFFTVLNWGIGDDYIQTADKVYTASGQDKLTYILNGKQVSSIANRIIGDQDKLLVNFGSQSSDEIQKEYSGIQNKALKEDTEQDPAGCSGHKVTTVHDRLTHMF